MKYLNHLKSLSNIQYFNILNNLITNQNLISINTTYEIISSEIFISTKNCYNQLFAMELMTSDQLSILIKVNR